MALRVLTYAYATVIYNALKGIHPPMKHSQIVKLWDSEAEGIFP